MVTKVWLKRRRTFFLELEKNKPLKRLNFFDQLVFLLNSIAATLLLMSYILPFLPPKSFSVLAVLSLAVPFLLLLNLIFLIYWLAQLKRQFILSLFVMALGYTHIKSSFNFNSNDNSQEKGIEIMSYNVHLLNLDKLFYKRSARTNDTKLAVGINSW